MKLRTLLTLAVSSAAAALPALGEVFPLAHDQREAFAVSDVIGVMSEGHIEQWDTAYNLYHRPTSRHVADFIGEGVFLPGTEIDSICGGHSHVKTELGFITPPDVCTHQHRDPRRVDVLLRPDDVVHDDSAPLKAIVLRKAFRGAQFMYTLRLPSGSEVLSLVSSHHDHAVGEAIGIRLEAEHVVTFSAQADARKSAPYL